MPRPLSTSALQRLGRRLITPDQPAQADLEQLRSLLAAHAPSLTSTVETVATEIGITPASRIKNTGTVLEKLRRNGGHTLSSIQDLAGLRIVVDGDRDEQDQVVESLTRTFAHAVRAPRVVDRRVTPVQGYRAVHVIVYPDGFPIEVQVRTLWQHRWAESFERLSDQYGRGIRYGEPPAVGGDTATQVIDMMLGLADQLAESEESGQPLPLSAAAVLILDSILDWLRTRQTGP